MSRTAYVALTLLYAGEQPPGQPTRYQIIVLGAPGEGYLSVKEKAEDHISTLLAVENPEACRQFLDHVTVLSRSFAKKHYKQEWNERRQEIKRCYSS